MDGDRCRHQRPDDLSDAVGCSRVAHQAGRVITTQAARLAHREQGDGGERQPDQHATEPEAASRRPDDAEGHARRLQDVTGGQQGPVVPVVRQTRGAQCADDQREAEHWPEQVRPRGTGQRMAGDHRQEGRSDDVAEARHAVQHDQPEGVGTMRGIRRGGRC